MKYFYQNLLAENEIIFEYFIKGARKKLVIEKNNIKKGNLEYK